MNQEQLKRGNQITSEIQILREQLDGLNRDFPRLDLASLSPDAKTTVVVTSRRDLAEQLTVLEGELRAL